jgi:hypothetical protein
MPTPPACPVCGAVLAAARVDDHVDWHSATQTLDGWTIPGALYALRQDAGDVDEHPATAQTMRLPPIGDTVRRRPPVPGVRELKGAELLRALADELDADDDVDGDDL